MTTFNTSWRCHRGSYIMWNHNKSGIWVAVLSLASCFWYVVTVSKLWLHIKDVRAVLTLTLHPTIPVEPLKASVLQSSPGFKSWISKKVGVLTLFPTHQRLTLCRLKSLNGLVLYDKPACISTSFEQNHFDQDCEKLPPAGNELLRILNQIKFQKGGNSS